MDKFAGDFDLHMTRLGYAPCSAVPKKRTSIAGAARFIMNCISLQRPGTLKFPYNCPLYAEAGFAARIHVLSTMRPFER